MTDIHWQDYITSDSDILFGKPVVKGTRVPVHLILEKLGKGETIADLLLAYPRVSEQAIQACLIFAAETVKNETVVSVAA
ncbi:MAG: DUF433 domain-containing protein [Saprospiraceae bacterium]|nr:DUF433 domain-containing protein [Saprospiraceae bacterium]